MICTHIKEQMGSLLDGEVNAEQRHEIEQHLAQCPDCAARFRELRLVAESLADLPPLHVPDGAWSAIEARLETGRVEMAKSRLKFARPLLGLAAVLLGGVGLGLFAFPWGGETISRADAATVDFSLLLDHLGSDAQAAFDRFLVKYEAAPCTVEAAKAFAVTLNFEVPEVLPGGFRLGSVYKLNFGNSPGVAARYYRNGEFLGVLFHPPVLREDFGNHRDYECVVGLHRGHTVAVGEWSLVHLTDPTTCHCVLSRLDPETELPAVLAEVAPKLSLPSHDVDH